MQEGVDADTLRGLLLKSDEYLYHLGSAEKQKAYRGIAPEFKRLLGRANLYVAFAAPAGDNAVD